MDKFVEKLMESKWTVRGLALILALLLFATAFIDEQGTTPIFANNTTRETIEDVPVVLYYDEENFVVSNAPQTVNVVVEGNKSIVQSTKNLRDFIVYLDLTDAKIGSQRVVFNHRDISDKLAVSIEPASVVVNVQEKVSEEFSVEAEFNRAVLEEGYTHEQPIIEPSTVKITGGKDVIEQISYVKAIIETNGSVNETFSQRAIISVLDKNLNKLDVIVEPDRVNVTIPVVSPKKTVPVVIKQTGTPQQGVIIKSIEPSIREIVIFGKKSVLDAINSIEIPVDVSQVESNEEITVPIELVEGVQSATPDSVNVQIEIDREETMIIEAIPIEVLGLDEQFNLAFLDPENGQVELEVTGPSEALKEIDEEDFSISIDVSDLTEGEHDLVIMINGPAGVEWNTEITSVLVEITARE